MMNRYRSAAGLLGAALLASCSISGDTGLQDITSPAPSAQIKFHNFAPNAVQVNFYANDTKMTAIASSACASPATAADSTACSTAGIESTVGTKYGAVASGGLYDGITPGQYTLTAKPAGGTDVVSTASQEIGDKKYYSFFMSGPYDATSKSAEAFVVEDPIPTDGDVTTGYVRLVDAVSDATGPLTLYLTDTQTQAVTTVGSPVSYKSAGDFVKVPPGTYKLSAGYAGSAISLISRTSSITVSGGHTYTVTAYGSTATASTLALDFTENQR